MKVEIVDDDVMVRDGLKMILDLEPDMEVVGVAGNGREAFDVCQSCSPDIILMDIRMPEVDGIQGTKLIKEHFKDVKILMLTTFKDDDYIKQAIKNGAEGYLLKNQSADVIIDAIRTLYKGSFVCEKGVMNSLKEMIENETKKNESFIDHIDLSGREKEILELIAQGLSNKEIGDVLFIGQGTVRNYVTSLLDKLQLRDRTQLAIFYLKSR